MAGPKKTSAAPWKPPARVRRSEPDRVLAFLARLATEFTAVLSLPDLLDHVLRVVREETGFDSCALALADERDPDSLTIRAATGIRASYLGLNVPAGKGLHGEVVKTGTSLLIPDMAADPRVFRREPNIRSGIYAPLAVRGHVTGVLSAHRSAPNAFTEADLNLLTVVARYLAGAVEVARLHDQLKELAATDPLTGLANRRSFLDRLGLELTRVGRTGGTLSLAILDLDRFKAVNDTYGHSIGDGALLMVAQTLSRSIRASDLAARFGGDEFTLLFPDSTAEQAREILDRIGITDVSFLVEGGGRVSLHFSWGIAGWPDDGTDADSLLQAADARLYAMKERSREGAPPDEDDATA